MAKIRTRSCSAFASAFSLLFVGGTALTAIAADAVHDRIAVCLHQQGGAINTILKHVAAGNRQGIRPQGC